MESIIRRNQNTTHLCNKLKSAEKQYPTLTKKEERELINKYKKDRETLNKLLFMHNIRIVFSCAKKYVSKTNDFDNLVQEGMRGLGEAAVRFDPSKDIKFITYATIWVLKYIKATFYGKQVDIEKHSSSLNAALDNMLDSSNNGTESTYENYINELIDPSYDQPKTIKEELSSLEQTEICTDLLKYMNNDTSLSSTDKSVFVELFYNKEKPRFVAEKYSITMTQVNDIRKRVLGKFKTILHTEYNVNSYQDISY